MNRTNPIQLEKGKRAEKEALRLLRIENSVQDRSSWALPNNSKPYAMDWFFPNEGKAVEFKYKKLSTHNHFFLDVEHYEKYRNYCNLRPEVSTGIVWFMNQTDKKEYVIDVECLNTLVYTGKIRYRYNADYANKSSGYYYSIHLDNFINVTDAHDSLNSIIKRNNCLKSYEEFS